MDISYLTSPFQFRQPFGGRFTATSCTMRNASLVVTNDCRRDDDQLAMEWTLVS